MNKIVRILLYVTLMLMVSCSRNTPPYADFTFTEEPDEIRLIATAGDDDDDPVTYQWSVSSSRVLLSNTTLSETWFRIPLLDTPLDITVELRVSDGKDETVVTRSITLPVMTEVRYYGLGLSLEREVSNDVSNEWYLDQEFSGRYSSVNCGPTSVTMAIKWIDSLFTGTPEDARNMYRPTGGWWYTDDVIAYLNHHSIHNHVISLSDMKALTAELDKKNIAIICLDMYLLRDEENARWHIDKFYPAATPDWGHFIVAKGYKIVDGNLFIEVYDPYGYSKSYTDGSPKGKNRYYRGSEIDASTTKWWNYAIIVTRDAVKSEGAIDPATIPHRYGG